MRPVPVSEDSSYKRPFRARLTESALRPPAPRADGTTHLVFTPPVAVKRGNAALISRAAVIGFSLLPTNELQRASQWQRRVADRITTVGGLVVEPAA